MGDSAWTGLYVVGALLGSTALGVGIALLLGWFQGIGRAEKEGNRK